jgi:hypothetical protein
MKKRSESVTQSVEVDLRKESDLTSAASPPVREALARRTYQELRDRGLSDVDIMAFAGDLLSLVASEVRAQSAAE